MSLWSTCNRWFGPRSGRGSYPVCRRTSKVCKPRIEQLEDRCVPTVSITQFSNGITSGSYPWGITTGPDNNLWFTEFVGTNGDGAIGRISASGAVTEFTTGISPGAGPQGITAGPDGNLWFTEYGLSQIGRITTAGTVTEFSTGITANSNPLSIVSGPNGNLWFTENGANQIGEMTTSGMMVGEFAVGAGPNDITVGPDGNLWFTENGANKIGELTPLGQLTEYSDGLTPNAGLRGITTGPDGNLWFVESTGGNNASGAIGRITTGGTVTEFSTGISQGADPVYITPGPDGALWFTENGANRVGRITTAGYVIEYPISQSINTGPMGITSGPDGNVWFAESNAGAIGRLGGVQAVTTTALTSSDTSPVAGETIVLTATIGTPNGSFNNTPTGVVTFYDGNRVIGAAAVSGNIAVISTNALAAGTHNLTASYAGNSNFAGSTSSVVQVQVGAANTTTTLTGPGAPSVFGQMVTFVATVSTTSGDPTPTGAVGFYSGNTLLGTAPLSGGLAVFSTASLPAGDNLITANYIPTANFNASTSSPPFDQLVGAANTTTTLTGPGAPSVFGQKVAFVATVSTTSGDPTPTGAVGFYSGNTLLGTAPLSGGLAVFSTASLPAGDNLITANYIPTANFNASTSSPPFDQLVAKVATTIVLETSSASVPPAYSQPIILTATVTTTDSTAEPTGAVSFYDGTTLVGTSAVSGGVATLTTTSLAAGDHPDLNAVYTPTVNFQASNTTTPLDEQITADVTGIGLGTSGTPSVAGQVVTFTATVTDLSGSAAPTGYVTFTDTTAHGATVLGSSVLSGGVALLTAALFTSGTNTIDVTFTPASANFQTSTTDGPGSLTQVVSPGVATQLVFRQQPTFTFVSTTFPLPVTVFVADAYGNPVSANTKVTVALASNPGNATLAGTRTATALNGVATFANLTLNHKGVGYTLAATGAGLASATSNAFTVSSATHFGIAVSTTKIAAGVSFNITVTALDSAGNVEPDYRGTVTVTAMDPALTTLIGSYTFTTADAGRHAFSVTLNTGGSRTIRVLDQQKPTITGSRTLAVTASPGSLLVRLKTLTTNGPEALLA
jgi:streptogramin lyase